MQCEHRLMHDNPWLPSSRIIIEWGHSMMPTLMQDERIVCQWLHALELSQVASDR